MSETAVWLNNLPANWTAGRLGAAFSTIYRYPTYYGISYVSAGIREVRGEAIQRDGKLKKLPDERYISVETAAQFSKTELKAGDIVMSVRGTLGKIGMVTPEFEGGNITANLLRLSPNRTGVAPAFAKWFMLSRVFQEQLDLVSVQTTIKTVTTAGLRQVEWPFPPLATQTAIADFLDRKTAAIDTLIAKKEELIRELAAYRQALITETVSKGLNPEVAVRQSGVPGLGEIPAHWQVAKTGKVLRYIKGKAVPKEDLALEGDASQRFWRTGDFWNLNNREKDEVFVTDSTGLVWKDEGELVVCFDGFNSEVGKGTVGMARFEGEGYIDSHLELITPRKKLACKKFLEYAHCSAWMEAAIVSQARGAIAYSAGYAKYELQLPLPPLAEQEAIAAYLDSKLATFYQARAAAVSQIAMLKEYRASLISEAVTGKLAIPTP